MRRFLRLGVVGFIVCWVGLLATAADLEDIKAKGVLTAVSFPHQESEFVRTNLDVGPTPALGPAEKFLGIDVEVLAGFAEELGVELQIRRVSEPSYGALIPDLLDGKGDLIASSFSITGERLKVVDFTVPYFTVQKVAVVRAGDSIDSIADVIGRRGAVIRGSSHHEVLRKVGVPDSSLVFVDFTLDCFTAVVDGEADYTLQDSLASEQHLRGEPGLEIALRFPGDDHYGFAVPKQSRELLAALNAYLDALRESGALDEIISRNLAGMEER